MFGYGVKNPRKGLYKSQRVKMRIKNTPDRKKKKRVILKKAIVDENAGVYCGQNRGIAAPAPRHRRRHRVVRTIPSLSLFFFVKKKALKNQREKKNTPRHLIPELKTRLLSAPVALRRYCHPSPRTCLQTVFMCK